MLLTIKCLLTCISQVPQREMVFQMQIEIDAMFTCWHVPLLNLLIRLLPKGPECLFQYGLFLLEAAPSTGGFSANCPELNGYIYLKISISWAYCRYKSCTNYICKFVHISMHTWITTKSEHGFDLQQENTLFFCLHQTKMLILMWVKGWTDNKQLPGN